MKKVYFICTGNTCRSPLATGLFCAYLHKIHMDFVPVDSAGLAASCGLPATDNAVLAAKALGADISAHRSRALTQYDFTENAFFVCMTDSHAAALRMYVPQNRLLVLNIPDPYLGDETVYRLCAQSIEQKMPTVFRAVFGFDVLDKMRETDVDGVLSVENICFSHPWTKQGIAEELENDTARFFVARKGGQVIGYIGANNVAGEVYITNIAVLPRERKKGIGEVLLSVLLTESEREKADFVSLEVRESNRAAISLYKKMGFQEAGRRKGFYRDPQEDALIYTKFFEMDSETQ